MSTLKDLEARIEALEKRKEPQLLFLRDASSKIEEGTATYVVGDDCLGYICGSERYFTLRAVVIAMARKIGLKIVYHYPTGEKIEYK